MAVIQDAPIPVSPFKRAEDTNATKTAVINTVTFGVLGNTRGVGSVDLQSQRDLATQVASGANSFVVGKNNTASGQSSVAMGTNCLNPLANTLAVNYNSSPYSMLAHTGLLGVTYNNAATGYYPFAAVGNLTCSMLLSIDLLFQDNAGIRKFAQLGGLYTTVDATAKTWCVWDQNSLWNEDKLFITFRDGNICLYIDNVYYNYPRFIQIGARYTIMEHYSVNSGTLRTMSADRVVDNVLNIEGISSVSGQTLNL